jgi:radical SAM/SPASM domain FxsB family protein
MPLNRRPVGMELRMGRGRRAAETRVDLVGRGDHGPATTGCGSIAPARFNTFILKVANRCNINCDYCYVFNSADLRARDLPARMGLDVVEVMADRVEEYATAQQLDTIHFVFHGGEPLLLGMRQMERILSPLDCRLGHTLSPTYTVQTNGTLLSDAWLDLFEEHGVSVGVSLDGPRRANDRHRLTLQGASTADAAIEGLRRLQAHPKLFAGILAVVDLVNDPDEVLQFLASFGPPTIDFNLPHANHAAPPLRRDESQPEYGVWLSRLFDSWVLSDAEDLIIRMFDDIIGLTLGAKESVEALGLARAGSITIESDGSIETIDALRSTAADETDLGMNVFENTFAEVARHPRIACRSDGKRVLSAHCQRCSLVDVCGGGSLPHRFHPVTRYDNPSVYCHDLAYLISHIQSRLQDVSNARPETCKC